MLVRGSRHCCCKPPKQCEVEIPLNEYSRFSFDAKEKEDENLGVYFDNGTSSVELAGQGSYTVRVTDNPKKIFVRTHILELNAGAGGITIRRPDSDQSISLWWMGGTSYELRHGTTVLESITHTAASQDLKLELTTPRDATTDVLVYIDATLVHTEVGVAFVMPDVLHLGMVVEGPTPMGGEIRFGFFEVSPCLASTCEPYATPACYDIPFLNEPLKVPKMWYVSIPWPSDFGFADCVTTPKATVYNQEAYFLLDDMDDDPIVYYTNEDDEWFVWSSCAYLPVTISKAILGVDTDTYPLPQGKYPTEYMGHCTLGNDYLPYTNDAFSFAGRGYSRWSLSFEFRNNGTPEAPDMQFRTKVGMTFQTAWTFPHILYTSDWMEADPNEELDSSITLNLTDNNSTYTGWDSTITLVPNGASPEVVKQLMGCSETCEPPVTPQPGTTYCMKVTLVDESETPITYSVSMSVGYNETTGSWEWTGYLGPWEHPTCGTVSDSNYKVHCVEPQEGATKQWALDITTTNGTSRIPLTDDPTFGLVFDGTTDAFCVGEIWDLFVLFPNPIEESVDIFGCDNTGCYVEGYCVSGVASCDTGTCTQNSFGNFLGITSSNPPGVVSKIGPAFTGPYPVAFPAGYQVWLWEDGSGIHLAVYNGTTLIEEATPLDIDCGQVEKTFGLSDVTFACCSGFGGVVITLTPCGGPIVHV